MKLTIAVSAHKYTIRETVDGPDVKRVVRNSPVAGPRVHREVVPVAGSSAGITRAKDKYGILSGTAVEFVIVGTLRHANLTGCDTLTLSVNGSSWANFGDGRRELGLDVTIDGSDLRAGGTFAQRRSEDEAGKDGEWENDSGETHFVEMRLSEGAGVLVEVTAGLGRPQRPFTVCVLRGQILGHWVSANQIRIRRRLRRDHSQECKHALGAVYNEEV